MRTTTATPRNALRRPAWHCLQRAPEWSRQTARNLTTVLQDPVAREAYTLAHLFRTLVNYRRPAALEPWLWRTERSGLPAFQRFVAGLRRDQAAVTAALHIRGTKGPPKTFTTRLSGGNA
ncbi:MAG: transposase [Clostridia bacterium]